MEELIWKYSLQNAVFYGGKADPKAVLGKIMANEPELRKKVKEIKELVDKIVKEVNSLSLEEQKTRLQEISPELLKREEKKQDVLPPLKDARPGKFITRFAPSPTGPLNLGQLIRGAFLPYLYAKKYKGKFILRFEDTDPDKIEKRYYDMIKEDLKVCGIKWDRLVVQSNRMNIYYKYAEELLEKNHAYMCSCSSERFRELKKLRQNCPCRDRSPEENVNIFHNAVKGLYKPGKFVMRLKTSMKDPNPAIRDPPIMRISDAEHPLKGNKYKFWPLYNYANAIDDYTLGVTHVFRGKEHEHNTEIQRRIYEYLGWKFPVVINFGMVYLPGEKLHTRDIKKMIREGKLSGWDDPRLHTIRALLRRGYQPEAFKKFAIQCGLTKHDIFLDWENLNGINRKIIDPVANRYMAVVDPVKISIEDGPEIKRVKTPLHPDFPERGEKTIPVNLAKIYIESEDFTKLKGKEVRLKHLGNVILDRKSRYIGDEIKKDIKKIHWVSEPYINIKIITPSETLKAIAEPWIKRLKTGSIVQFERFGFCRLDSKKEMIFYFTHK